jgi:hypothetical protein
VVCKTFYQEKYYSLSREDVGKPVEAGNAFNLDKAPLNARDGKIIVEDLNLLVDLVITLGLS